jgi:hypothetical protein
MLTVFDLGWSAFIGICLDGVRRVIGMYSHTMSHDLVIDSLRFPP